VGHVIQAAIRAGITTQSIFFHRQKYLDIGTPEGLKQMSTGKWFCPSDASPTA
jgi:hypothetical protein